MTKPRLPKLLLFASTLFVGIRDDVLSYLFYNLLDASYKVSHIACLADPLSISLFRHIWLSATRSLKG